MFIEERLMLEESRIRQSGRAEVTEIARELGISVDTVRRDLKILEERGLVIRTRGGALAPELSAEAPGDWNRFRSDQPELRRMAELAAAHISDGQSIFLDGSAAVGEIIPFLKSRRNFIIYTCSPFIASRLVEIDVEGRMELIGGRLCVTSDNAFGLETVRRLEKLAPDVVVLGSCALSTGGILSASTPDDASIRQLLLERGKRILFFLEPEMWDRELLISLGPVPENLTLFTVPGLADEVRRSLADGPEKPGPGGRPAVPAVECQDSGD